MISLRLWIAVLFGVFIFGSAVLFCPQAHAGGSGVAAPGAGGDIAPSGEPTARATRVQLGLGAGAAPDYEGSNDYKAVPMLFARVDWASGMFCHLEGASARMNVVPSPNWRLGPVLRYIPARGHVEDDNPSLTVEKKLFRKNGQIGGVKKFLALHSPCGDDHSSRIVEGGATPTA